MRLGLVYLPDATSSDACVTLSEALVRSVRPRVTLGRDGQPHVTLLHIETDVDPAACWRAFAERVPHEATMAFAALAFLRYDVAYNAPPATLPGTMAYLIVPCTTELRAAEERALECDVVRASRVTTGNGVRFMPHVTVAIWDGECVPSDVVLSPTVVGRAGVIGRLALGAIGPNGAYERTFFGA